MKELKPLTLDKKPAKFTKLFLKFWWLILAVLIILVSYFFINIYSGSSNPVLKFVGVSKTLQLENGQVNILLLGIAGGRHDGPNLTDTIIVASINPKNGNVVLFSLPRDIWIAKYNQKINALYEIGLEQNDGLGFTKGQIGEILGIKIPYAIRIDFAGFIKAVDQVGGLDVDVQNSFEDWVYPIPGKEDELCGYQEKIQDITEDQAKSLHIQPGRVLQLLAPDGHVATSAASPDKKIEYNDDQVLEFFPCRFEHLKFKKGLTHMDGDISLKFVRSRHGNNGEGSDFARSRRQQLVLQSFKTKALSLGTLTDPQKIVGLVKAFGSSIDTNINPSDYLLFINLVKHINEVRNYVIDQDGDKSLLITPPLDKYGAWVLIPPDNDFSSIHQFVKDSINLSATSSAKLK